MSIINYTSKNGLHTLIGSKSLDALHDAHKPVVDGVISQYVHVPLGRMGLLSSSLYYNANLNFEKDHEYSVKVYAEVHRHTVTRSGWCYPRVGQLRRELRQ